MSQTPLISLVHPTARVKPYPSFPRGWMGACKQFHDTAVQLPHIEYVLVVHESRWQEFMDNLPVLAAGEFDLHSAKVINHPAFSTIILHMPWFGELKIVRNTGRDCVVDQINAGAAASTGHVILGMMDDLEAPKMWDVLLDELVRPHIRKGKPIEGTGLRYEVFHIEEMEPDWSRPFIIDLTGEDSNWIVYGAMTRARYEDQGFVLHPDFESMSADNYFSHCAHRDGVVINGRHLGFKHRHPIYGLSQTDAVYEQQNRKEAYMQGEATFNRLTKGTRTIACCFPGETFSFAANCYQKLLMHSMPARNLASYDHEGHSTNVYVTRIELADGVINYPVKMDFVYWQDDDNYILPEQFDMLLADLDAHPELDGVVGWCWCDNDQDGNPDENGDMKAFLMSCGRQTEDMRCMRFTLEDIERAKATGNWLITSDDIFPDYFWSGFPCVLLRGETQRKLGWRAFKPLHMPNVKWEFTSEDTSFFYNATRAGMKFAVDLRVKVPHMKLRAIEPQYLPTAARAEVDKAQGKIRTARDFMEVMETVGSGAD